jgi:hypothetical protein
MLPELKINRGRMENGARDPNLLATDLAEYLVKKECLFARYTKLLASLLCTP